MKPYSLSALLELRELEQNTAKINLYDALAKHEAQVKKLEELLESLGHWRLMISNLERDFFLKPKSHVFTRNDINNHPSASKRMILNKETTMNLIDRQKDQVKQAYHQIRQAEGHLLKAQRDLKVIHKHYANWQKSSSKHEEKRAQYENDDQNGLRFFYRSISS